MSNNTKKEKKAKEDAVKKQQQELDLFGYISDEDDIIPEFLEATEFYGYLLSKLINPIEYRFEHPVKLTKTKFNYRVHGIHLSDLANINKLVKRVEPSLKVNMAESFMTGKHTLFLDVNDTLGVGSFRENEMWTLKIHIQGYKTAPGGRKSPMFNIRTANLVFFGIYK